MVGAMIHRPVQGSVKFPPVRPPKRTSSGVAAHHLRGAVGTKRRRTSGRERCSVHEFPWGCDVASHGMQIGRSSGTPPLVRIRARHRCEFVWNRFVKAKALAERRRKLRIPRFRPRAKSSLTPLCPKEIPLGDSSFPHRTHLTAGLRRGPRFGTRRFQRTKGPLARLSSISFVVIRKIWPPEGVSPCEAANWFWSSRILHSLSNCSASIPPVSLRTPPPFTQGRLWFPVAPNVRWKIEAAVQEPLSQHS